MNDYDSIAEHYTICCIQIIPISCIKWANGDSWDSLTTILLTLYYLTIDSKHLCSKRGVVDFVDVGRLRLPRGGALALL